MKFKKLLLSLLITNSLVLGVFAQGNVSHEAALHPKTVAFALEVFNDVVDYQTPEHLLAYSKEIRQVTIVYQGNSASSLPSLQSVGLITKYNPNLLFDQDDFDVESFNPLKYHFDFYSSEIQRFRVGNSGYVVVINPQLN